MNAIVARIYELMSKSGISKVSLADKIGVSRNTIQNWKKFDSYPTLAVIEQICGVFGLTTEQFFDGIGNNECEKSQQEFMDDWRMLSENEKTLILKVIEEFKELRQK